MNLREPIFRGLWLIAVDWLGLPTRWPAAMDRLDRWWIASMPLGDRARANGAKAIAADLPRLIDEMRYHDETADTLPAPDPGAWVCLAGDGEPSAPDAADWQTLHDGIEPCAFDDWATGKGWPS